MRKTLVKLLKDSPHLATLYNEDLEWEEAADYLLAEGVIVPFAECGTDIYGAFEWEPEYVFEGTLVSYSLQRDGLWFYCHYSNGLNMWHKIDDFGKTVFLTKEEAEKALAEGVNDEKV